MSGPNEELIAALRNLPPMPSADDGHCEERHDGVHCDHWWDGEPCCACGYNGGEVEP